MRNGGAYASTPYRERTRSDPRHPERARPSSPALHLRAFGHRDHRRTTGATEPVGCRAATRALAAPGHHTGAVDTGQRSEEHTSELQSLMRISYAVFCLKQKTTTKIKKSTNNK